MADDPKTVLVAGGTYGIGRGIVMELAGRGWRVVAFGLSERQPGSAAEGGVEGTRAALAEAGLDGQVLEGDIADEADVARAVAAALTATGRIEALVNNAAIRPTGTVVETPPDDFDRVLAVNLKGPYLTSRAVIPHMAEAGGGAIVNIGSGSGWGKARSAAYCASKGGVFALSAAMAYDHLEDGIRVNTVVPGPQTQSGIVEAMAARGPVPRVLTASGRQTQPRDIAAAVAFLLSDEAVQISGTVIDVGAFAHQGGVGQPRG